MMMAFITFGVLVGLTAAVLTLTAGAGPLAALLAYASFGTLGLLGMALPEVWAA